MKVTLTDDDGTILERFTLDWAENVVVLSREDDAQYRSKGDIGLSQIVRELLDRHFNTEDPT